MDSLARVVILLMTVIALIYIFSHQPKHVEDVVIPYCPISYPAAEKDRYGEWHYGFAQSYGPCSLMDRYEEI